MTEISADPSDVLNAELRSRKERNLSYSMRAFARDLGVSSARLSRILAGKAAPSRPMAKKIGQRLGYRDDKLDWFCALVDARHEKDPAVRAQAVAILERYPHGVANRKIDARDTFDWKWYHFAIRRVTQLANFRLDYEWLGMNLGIPPQLVQSAIEDLLRAGALDMKDGRLVLRENYSIYFKGDKRNARETLERDLFSLKLKSLAAPSRDRSHHAHHFFTLSRAQVEELKRLVRSFEDQVDDLTYRADKPDDLFCLSIDLWSLLAPAQVQNSDTDGQSS